jgi:hypothetical protein
MIKRIHDDIDSALDIVPFTPINLFNKNRSQYYTIDNGALIWTANSKPELFPYVSYEIQSVKYYRNKDMIDINLVLEYSTLSDIDNSKPEEVHTTGMTILAQMVHVLTYKKSKNHPNFCWDLQTDPVFRFYEQFEYQLRTGIVMEATFTVPNIGFYSSICCTVD